MRCRETPGYSYIRLQQLHYLSPCTLAQSIFRCPYSTVGDRGFPVGWGADPLGGRGPLTQELFGENVCENARIGSRGSAKALSTH